VTIAVPKVVTVKVKKKVRGKLRTITVKKTISQAISTCASSTPCDTAVHLVTIAPGGTTGWHSHPGSTSLAMASGEGVEYHAEGTSCMSGGTRQGAASFRGSTSTFYTTKELFRSSCMRSTSCRVARKTRQ